MPRYTGGCLCGAVRIEIAAAPYRVGICHCLDCRKRQGAIFHSFAVFPMDAVTVTGETREFKNRHFCPICGSPLFDRWATSSSCTPAASTRPTSLRPRTKVGLSAARPGCRLSTSRTTTSATALLRGAAIRSR